MSSLKTVLLSDEGRVSYVPSPKLVEGDMIVFRYRIGGRAVFGAGLVERVLWKNTDDVSVRVIHGGECVLVKGVDVLGLVVWFQPELAE